MCHYNCVIEFFIPIGLYCYPQVISSHTRILFARTINTTRPYKLEFKFKQNVENEFASL